jgi:hypothetical protein
MGRRGLTVSLVTVGTVGILLTAAFLTVPALRGAVPSSRTVADPAPAPPLTTSPPTAGTPSPTTSAPPPSTADPVKTLSAAERQKLASAVTATVNKISPKAMIGFTIYDRKTGETLTSVNPDTPMYTASVVKLLIAIDSLREDDWDTESDTADDITEMLEGSNDATASSLWVKDGGPPIVARMAGLIGLHHTFASDDPGQWGMAKASANDVVTIYQYIDDDLPDNASKLIMDALAKAKNPADDGFPQYFGIPDALPGTTWAVKQGWMVLTSSLVLNTTGVVGSDSRYVVALMTQLRAGTSEAKGRTALTAGISAVAPTLKG